MSFLEKTIVEDSKHVRYDLSNTLDFVKLIFKDVPDPVTRSLLFGLHISKQREDIPGKLRGGSELIEAMTSVINLSFVVALTHWKQYMDNPDFAKNSQFTDSRFSKIFSSALGMEDITLDLQIFALMELWVSLKNHHINSEEMFNCFFRMSNGLEDFGLILQAARDAIKNASFKTWDQKKYTATYLNVLFYNLIHSFRYLNSVTIAYPEDPFSNDPRALCITHSTLDDDVNLYPNTIMSNTMLVVTEQQLIVMSSKSAEEAKKYINGKVAFIKLFLLSETSAFNGETQYIYRSFDGSAEGCVRSKIEIKEDISAVTKKNMQEMRRLLCFNYKNIREFALVISDAIKGRGEVMEKVAELYNERKNNVSGKFLQEDEADLFRDNIITLLLAELGPSEFLEKIFEAEGFESIFYNILANIRQRVAGSDKYNRVLKEYNDAMQNCRNLYKGNNDALKTQQRLLCISMLLNAMGFEKEEDSVFHPFEESLNLKFETICNCISGIRENSEVVAHKYRDMLRDVFKCIFQFLQIFYTGMDAYARKKFSDEEVDQVQLPENNLNADKNSREYRRMYRRMLMDTFAKAAARKYAQICDQNLSESYQGFCQMCMEYNQTGGFSISEKAQFLKKIITRNYICDVSKLDYFTHFEIEGGGVHSIFEMLDNYFDKYQELERKYNWLDYFKDLFLFLIYNEDYNKHGLFAETNVLDDKDCDPIYPYLVTYYREDTDRDNFKKCSYKVPIPTSKNKNAQQGYVVTLLTEDEYPSNTYFCIPLRYGSSDNWWINPFLIPRGVIYRMKNELRAMGKTLKS